MNDILILLIIGDNQSKLDGLDYICRPCLDYVLHSEACLFIDNLFKEKFDYPISTTGLTSYSRDGAIKYGHDVAKNNNILFYNSFNNGKSKFGFLTLPKVLTDAQYKTYKKYECIIKDYCLDVKVFDEEKEIYNNKIYNDENYHIGYNKFNIDEVYNDNHELREPNVKRKTR